MAGSIGNVIGASISCIYVVGSRAAGDHKDGEWRDGHMKPLKLAGRRSAVYDVRFMTSGCEGDLRTPCMRMGSVASG